MPVEQKEEKYYAVKVGRKPGIYNTWAECKEQVNGFKGCKFKSFLTYEEAVEYMNDNNDAQQQKNPEQEQIITDTPKQDPSITENESKKKTPKPKDVKIYVIGRPETKEEPASYVVVLECNGVYKLLNKSYFYPVPPVELIVDGIIDAASLLKFPCNITVIASANLASNRVVYKYRDVIQKLSDFIEEKGHKIDFINNVKRIESAIKRAQLSIGA